MRSPVEPTVRVATFSFGGRQHKFDPDRGRLLDAAGFLIEALNFFFFFYFFFRPLSGFSFNAEPVARFRCSVRSLFFAVGEKPMGPRRTRVLARPAIDDRSRARVVQVGL